MNLTMHRKHDAGRRFEVRMPAPRNETLMEILGYASGAARSWNRGTMEKDEAPTVPNTGTEDAGPGKEKPCALYAVKVTVGWTYSGTFDRLPLIIISGNVDAAGPWDRRAPWDVVSGLRELAAHVAGELWLQPEDVDYAAGRGVEITYGSDVYVFGPELSPAKETEMQAAE